jgi:hypothetical protein
MGRANNEPRRMVKDRGNATLSGPASQDYGGQIPTSLSRQTMHAIPLWYALMFQLMSEIKSRKNENQKSHRFLSDATSTLSDAQCPNRLHRHKPHGEEGRIVCSFDLRCQRLAKIMGHLQTVPQNRYLSTFNKLKHFSGHHTSQKRRARHLRVCRLQK